MKHVLLLVALAACNPTLTVQSPQPPGRIARMDPVRTFWGLQRYRLELSRGVAIALTCDLDGPCEHMQVVSDDPAIAEVRPASLGVLQQGGLDGEQTSAALVVVGKAPGATRLHVRSKGKERDVVVTVVAPPEPGALTAAR
ncbi:MAG: hypothetical protein JO257_16815 [Deltaproteobacteria bacterium]|nr:hypothetical protein [Deltaproteobacteria bacterium]